jgi:hypothetical protein
LYVAFRVSGYVPGATPVGTLTFQDAWVELTPGTTGAALRVVFTVQPFGTVIPAFTKVSGWMPSFVSRAVTFNVAPGYDQNQLQSQLQASIAQMGLPGNVSTVFGGDASNQSEGFSALITAMGMSVLLVYIVLASQFGSFTQPFVIMLAMPFSFLGAFVALRLVNMPLDITGMIGLIMLLGLVVKNSILMVDFANQLRRAGMDKHTAQSP